MGMFWLRNKISPTKILVSSIGDENISKSELDTDSYVYTKYYRQVITKIMSDIKELIALIETRNFNIIHIFARIDNQGNIDGMKINDFFHICSANDIKLVFLALNNDKNTYVHHIKPSSFNLVFTLDRRKENFVNFLDGLLSRMAAGKTLPRAWVELVPQTQTAPEHKKAPDCILLPGSPHTVFLP